MPDRLTLEATLVLVAIALGLAFGAAALVGGGASAVKPIASEQRPRFEARHRLPWSWASRRPAPSLRCERHARAL